MKYPKSLMKQGTIGFVAPSFGCNTEPYRSAFDHAKEVFAVMGYHTVCGPNCYEGSGIGISNTPEKCGKELTEFYVSGENDVLISCGGGELMCEDLDYVDFEAMGKANPKWYMGFSDNTNMTFLLPTLLDTASVYGPCAPAFGMEPWHPVLKDAMDILTGKKQVVSGYETWEKESLKDEEHPLAPYNAAEKKILKIYDPMSGKKEAVLGEDCREITLNGRLLGGCMDCLGILLGTKFDRVAEFNEKYKEDGILWFLEACDLNVMSIRRVLWQMEHAGWFRYAKGFLIGRPLQYGQELMGLDQYEAALGILRAHQVPVIMDVDLGHLPPSMPLVTGSLAEVEVKSGNLKVKMEFR